jgi:hypothetical protein
VTTPYAYTQVLLGPKTQAVSPHCQHGATRVEVSINDQPTGAATIHPLRQREILFPDTTASATLPTAQTAAIVGAWWDTGGICTT